jgi:hypothetical protein
MIADDGLKEHEGRINFFSLSASGKHKAHSEEWAL